jgi:hypothetical protein
MDEEEEFDGDDKSDEPVPPADSDADADATSTSDTAAKSPRDLPRDPLSPTELQELEHDDGLYRVIDAEPGTPRPGTPNSESLSSLAPLPAPNPCRSASKSTSAEFQQLEREAHLATDAPAPGSPTPNRPSDARETEVDNLKQVDTGKNQIALDDSGRTRRVRKARAINLRACMCGIDVSEAEIQEGEKVFQCKVPGCETQWVSIVMIFIEELQVQLTPLSSTI